MKFLLHLATGAAALPALARITSAQAWTQASAQASAQAYPARQTPETLAALQRAYAEKWWPVIKELGLKPG